MKIVVLTSKENFVWHSMQEIIPHLENMWINLHDKNYEVVLINVDTAALADITKEVLTSSLIVLTCFNYRICKVAEFIRFKLNVEISYAIHVHNMATIAFWPFRTIGNLNFFKKNDIFITSSSNDERLIKAVFENPVVFNIPFNVPSSNLDYSNKSFSSIDCLTYIGRISPQKNIHLLLLAYRVLKDRLQIKLPPLVIFGKEDHLGAPNMLVENRRYLDFLKSIVKKLDLTDDVDFKGHVLRDQISHFLQNKNCLCVSASLHSDENFGMVILQSIYCGNQNIITDWGGHSDFKRKFFDRVSLIPVLMGSYGPYVSLFDLVDMLEPSIKNRPLRDKLKIPIEFSNTYGIDLLKKSLSINYEKSDLTFSTLSESILKQRLGFSLKNNATQIFYDFTDPLFHQISKYYIGQIERRFRDFKNRSYFLAPWVDIEENFLVVEDPHRGLLRINIDTKNERVRTLEKENTSIEVCEEVFKKLVELSALYGS